MKEWRLRNLILKCTSFEVSKVWETELSGNSDSQYLTCKVEISFYATRNGNIVFSEHGPFVLHTLRLLGHELSFSQRKMLIFLREKPKLSITNSPSPLVLIIFTLQGNQGKSLRSLISLNFLQNWIICCCSSNTIPPLQWLGTFIITAAAWALRPDCSGC